MGQHRSSSMMTELELCRVAGAGPVELSRGMSRAVPKVDRLLTGLTREPALCSRLVAETCDYMRLVAERCGIVFGCADWKLQKNYSGLVRFSPVWSGDQAKK
jgi:hypothetical protein